MAPVDADLPEPPKTLSERPVFLQAKEELKQMCSAETTAHARLLGGTLLPCPPSDVLLTQQTGKECYGNGDGRWRDRQSICMQALLAAA